MSASLNELCDIFCLTLQQPSIGKMVIFIWCVVSPSLFIKHVIGTSGNVASVYSGGAFIWKMELLSIIETIQNSLAIIFLVVISHFLITYLPKSWTTAYQFSSSTKLMTADGINYGSIKFIVVSTSNCFSRSRGKNSDDVCRGKSFLFSSVS